MHRLIYLSETDHGYTHQVLLNMCAEFASRNTRADITGVLLRAGRYYFQILEGAHDAITQLAEKIAEDERHYNFHILSERSAEARLFAQWGMNLLDCGNTLEASPAMRLALQKQLLEIEDDFSDGKSKAEQILRSFRLAVQNLG